MKFDLSSESLYKFLKAKLTFESDHAKGKQNGEKVKATGHEKLKRRTRNEESVIKYMLCYIFKKSY